MEAKLNEFRRKKCSMKWLVALRSTADRWENDVVVIVLKVLIWLTLLVIFVRLEFCLVYILVSLLYLILSNLSCNRRENELSAYSVFNRHFEKLPGTFSGEDFHHQLRGI